ncbi:alpha/beta fold hydrolase [Aerococcus tenax]|uniref:Alpha/beta fold hydrolase n=1 Tax=Aerococcus tenax TaxID=3078812 RepID=A0A5N1BUA6_9LACT|nr:alpha/beta fold hydrolase [Aerococcus urinae]RAV70980.1 alpha/beta hydrolase [Aerococcus urinae]RAW04847.1 alpha/beta hydrolase [Aerococcus urinae]
MDNVLIHGLGQDSKSWADVKEYLKEENWTTYAPNLFELLNNGPYTYQNLYNQFESHINNYEGKVNLCGLSLGGLLALDYAKNYPNKVNSLILIGVPYKIPKLLMDIQAMVFRLMSKRTFETLGLAKDDFISLLRSTKDLNIATNLKQVDCKTLLICGKKDRFNLKSSKLFHERIKNSELSVVKNSGHEVNTDNPKALAELISEFWKK